MKQSLKSIWEAVIGDDAVLALIGGIIVAVLAAALKSAVSVFTDTEEEGETPSEEEQS